jgi:putative heme iron utilization protein
MSEDDPASLARRWLRESDSGTLCTLSRARGIEGWPFGSIVPFVVDDGGRPVILIAQIAEHTKNATADSRVSLFVSERREGDPQAGWRLNLAGHLKRLTLDDNELAPLRERYIQKVPASSSYALQHDFFFWRLDVERVRCIAGFGRIHWIDGKDMLTGG